MINTADVQDPPSPTAMTLGSTTDGQSDARLAEGATSAEVSEYIADLLQELRELSQVSGQASLSLLLELAQREAKRTARRAVNINQTPIPPMAG
jgi:hypothetical protein